MKAVKLSIAIFVAMMVMVLVLPAQVQKQDKEKMKEQKEMGEKIKASKIAFITEHLALTPEEAEKFWPVYNEFEEKRNETTRSLIEGFRGYRHGNAEEISDEEAEGLMDQRFKQEESLLELKKEYHKKYLDILSAKKVLKLYDAENLFKRHLMEKFGREKRERTSEGRGSAPPYRGSRMCR